MAQGVDNLVLEQLRLIREDMKHIDKRFDDIGTQLDDTNVRLQSVEGVLFALGGYIRGIDTRVEHIEQKLGIDG